MTVAATDRVDDGGTVIVMRSPGGTASVSLALTEAWNRSRRRVLVLSAGRRPPRAGPTR